MAGIELPCSSCHIRDRGRDRAAMSQDVVCFPRTTALAQIVHCGTVVLYGGAYHELEGSHLPGVEGPTARMLPGPPRCGFDQQHNSHPSRVAAARFE
jgi:hypothetical protein